MSNRPRILLATWPFGTTGSRPLDLLRETGWELIANPHSRRLKPVEVAELIGDVDAVIAGTEPYTAEALAGAQRLRVIARVGIGLDSVDLDYCRQRGVAVTYTPDAPSQAVAELTVGNMIALLRHVHESDTSVREGVWNRLMGLLVGEATIGILGMGRIGGRVVDLLAPFGARILACDTDPEVRRRRQWPAVEWVDEARLLKESDVVSLHIPLNRANRGYLSAERLEQMKPGALLINTSRGPVVDEAALTRALTTRRLGGAALDVFENEPYEGPLARLDHVILTAHIGASARGSRYLMELGAAEDCVRVLNGEPPAHDALADMEWAE